MAGTPYLVDSNVRWVKPDDRDYPLVVSAIDATLQRGAVFCYTSQNVAEFWNTCTRPLDRNGYGLAGSGYTARAEKPCWASVFAAVFLSAGSEGGHLANLASPELRRFVQGTIAALQYI